MYKVRWEKEALKSLDKINWKIAEKIRIGDELLILVVEIGHRREIY